MADVATVPVGGRVWFLEEKLGYRVRARNARYLICTKPFNPRRTVLYCIVDLEEQVRGPENLIFCCGAETDEQCQEMLQRVASGETEVSYRHRAPLNITLVKDK